MESRSYKPLPAICVGMVKNQVSASEGKKLLCKKKKCKATKIFDSEWLDHGLPVPVPEFKFHHTRKWRFDFAFVNAKLAIEIDGGVWTNGRHNRGSGFIKDLDKINTAQCLGWIVLRYLPKKIKFDEIKAVLDRQSMKKITIEIPQQIYDEMVDVVNREEKCN